MRLTAYLVSLSLAACGSDQIGEVTVDARGLDQVWWMEDDVWTQLEVEADGRARFEPSGPYAIAGMCTQGGYFDFPMTLVRLAGAGDPTSWWLPCFVTDGGAVVTNASSVAVDVFFPRGQRSDSIAAESGANVRVPDTTGDVVAVGEGVQILRGAELLNGAEIVVDPMSDSVPIERYDLDVTGADVEQLYGDLVTRDHTEAFLDGPAGVRPSDLEAGDQQHLYAGTFVDAGQKFARIDIGPGTDDPGRIEVDLSVSVPTVSVDATDDVVVTWSPDDAWPHQRVVITQVPSSMWMDVEAFPGWTSAESDREHRLTVPELPDWGTWNLEAGADVYHWDVTLSGRVSPRIERGVFARNW